MRTRFVIWVIGLGLLGGGGCQLAEQGVHVMAYKAQQRLQEHAELSRDRRWADEAWQAVCLERPDRAANEDYATGFKDGFVEHVWRGGSGEPPPLPPLKYRAIRYQTASGYQAIESWFAGYRHGAWAAHHGGYRDLVTGPSSLRGAAPSVPEAAVPVPGDVRPVPGQKMPSAVPDLLTPTPDLPPPRPVEKGEKPGPSPQPPMDLARRWDWLDPRSGRPAWEAPSPPAPVLAEPPSARQRVRVYAEGETPETEEPSSIRVLGATGLRVGPRP